MVLTHSPESWFPPAGTGTAIEFGRADRNRQEREVRRTMVTRVCGCGSAMSRGVARVK